MHLYRWFNDRFGAAGLIVAFIALVTALAGTAIAAGGLTTHQKKEVAKIAKKFAGRPGAIGPVGPQGPKGDPGAPGANGKDGTNGKSAVISNAAPGCTEGGVTVEVEGSGVKHEVCNGEPGPLLETLESGQSETGAWGYFNPEVGVVVASYPFRLEAPIAQEDIVFLEAGEEETEDCPGTAEEPKAAGGKLCFYTREGAGNFVANIGFPRTSTTGAMILIESISPNFAFGSWALTAP